MVKEKVLTNLLDQMSVYKRTAAHATDPRWQAMFERYCDFYRDLTEQAMDARLKDHLDSYADRRRQRASAPPRVAGRAQLSAHH